MFGSKKPKKLTVETDQKHIRMHTEKNPAVAIVKFKSTPENQMKFAPLMSGKGSL